MRKTVRAALAVSWVFALTAPAHAFTTSDRGAGVLVWPEIVVDTDDDTDTVLQMSNLSSSQVVSHCFYVNANSHCSNTGLVCEDSSDCIDTFQGACVPGWNESNFDIVLTPEQPLAWRASEGLGTSDLPLSGNGRCAVNPAIQCSSDAQCPVIDGQFTSCSAGQRSNSGTGIPPVSEDPFIGELKCIQVERTTRRPAPCDGDCDNDLVGHAGIQTGVEWSTKYNAVGLLAVQNDGNGQLVIGGDSEDAEYEPCAEVLVLNHFFDDAENPIDGSSSFETTLTLVPCTQDFVGQTLTTVTAQFLVYNEFEQRFSSSEPVDCQLHSQISLIDTTQPGRSIWNVGVSGTVAGQTRIRGVNGGFIGNATANIVPVPSASYNLNQAVFRMDSDTISIP